MRCLPLRQPHQQATSPAGRERGGPCAHRRHDPALAVPALSSVHGAYDPTSGASRLSSARHRGVQASPLPASVASQSLAHLARSLRLTPDRTCAQQSPSKAPGFQAPDGLDGSRHPPCLMAASCSRMMRSASSGGRSVPPISGRTSMQQGWPGNGAGKRCVQASASSRDRTSISV